MTSPVQNEYFGIYRRLIPLLLLTVSVSACSRGSAGSETADAEDAAVSTTVSNEPSDRPATSDRVRVLFFGDSITAGYGLGQETQAFPYVFERIANENGIPVDVTAAGNSGETTAGGLRRIDWVMRTPYDIVVIELGGNDGLRGVPASAARSNLTEIVRKVREHAPSATVVVAGMRLPPSMGSRYVSEFENIYQEVASDTGSELLPFILEGVGGIRELNQGDGIHPTAKGHEIIGDKVWTFLEPLLRKDAGTR